MLYISGSPTHPNLTPRPGDVDGLSSSTAPDLVPGNRWIEVDESKFETLEVRDDPDDPDHKLIRPISDEALAEWRSNWGKPSVEEHPLTNEVMGAFTGKKGKKGK